MLTGPCGPPQTPQDLGRGQRWPWRRPAGRQATPPRITVPPAKDHTAAGSGTADSVTSSSRPGVDPTMNSQRMRRLSRSPSTLAISAAFARVPDAPVREQTSCQPAAVVRSTRYALQDPSGKGFEGTSKVSVIPAPLSEASPATNWAQLPFFECGTVWTSRPARSGSARPRHPGSRRERASRGSCESSPRFGSIRSAQWSGRAAKTRALAWSEAARVGRLLHVAVRAFGWPEPLRTVFCALWRIGRPARERRRVTPTDLLRAAS